jgi:hypothetical protein
VLLALSVAGFSILPVRQFRRTDDHHPLVDDQSGFGEPGLRELFTNQLTNLISATA